MAATYLWNWTGRKYGLCEVNLRPCRQDCWEGQSTFWGGTGSLRSTPYYPVIIRGAWTNISCGKCGDGCSCDGTPAFRLPGPIRSEERGVGKECDRTRRSRWLQDLENTKQ